MNFFSLLKKGQRYLLTWPLEKKLAMIFPENRVIRATMFGQKFMPFIAVFAILWQQFYAKGDYVALAAAILTGLVALALPLQGLYWLGKRATTYLPPKSAVWFKKICTMLKKQNIVVPVKETPTYQDLADVLKKAQQKLDPDFWQDI